MKINLFNKFKINVVYIVVALLVISAGTGIGLTYFTKYKLDDADAKIKAAASIDSVGDITAPSDAKTVIDKLNNTSFSDSSANDEHYFDSEINNLR